MTKAQDAARKARTLAAKTGFTKHGSKDIVKADAKLNKKNLTPMQEKKAVDAMQTRRMNDRDRTASRAEFIAKRDDPRNNKERMKKAIRQGNIDFEKLKKAANATGTPKAKPKTLNDFLKEGKRPPSKNKKIPSDADVIIKGYNDKKTLSKNKKKK